MNKENMKNMVVLKDLPSNIVEEAIIILKSNVKVNNINTKINNAKGNKKLKKENERNSKEYIVNEAQMVISNYLSSIEKEKKKTYCINKKIESKYKKTRIVCIFLFISLILSFIIK